MTCWLGEPPGSCSMLTTELFGNAAVAISAARSITSLLDTAPESIDRFVIDRHVDVFAGEQPLQVLLQHVTPRSTTTS